MALGQCLAFDPPHADHMYEVLHTYLPYGISNIPIHALSMLMPIKCSHTIVSKF